MRDASDRLERLSTVAAMQSVVIEVRDELVCDFYRAGTPVEELENLTGLSKPRIYQIIAAERPLLRGFQIDPGRRDNANTDN